MSKPLVVSIPHNLGKDEALRRIKFGMGRARTSLGGLMSIADETWTGDQMAFDVGLLGQRTSGTLQVADDHVRIEVLLPWFLQTIADKARAIIEKQGQLMLEKK